MENKYNLNKSNLKKSRPEKKPGNVSNFVPEILQNCTKNLPKRLRKSPQNAPKRPPKSSKNPQKFYLKKSRIQKSGQKSGIFSIQYSNNSVNKKIRVCNFIFFIVFSSFSVVFPSVFLDFPSKT